MTAETLDRPTRRRIEKAAAKKEKLLIRIRTEMRTGNGTYFSPWRILKDDPKNGIYDLTNWKRKYQAFDGHYASRKRYPSRYREEKNVWYVKRPGSTTYTPFPPMTDAEQAMFDDFFMSQRSLYLDFIANKILEGELRDDLKLDALEAIYDGIRAAYLKYDPEHPPKYRPENGGKPKPASRETFCARVARNTLSDFIDIMNADKRGFRVKHLSITERSRKEIEAGEVSAECLADDRRDSVRDMEFRIDVEILRNRLPSHLRVVLDMLLEEWPHYLIRQQMGISNDKYERRYLSPIQKFAADLGFEPSDDDAFIDKMYVFHRKVRKMRRERERRMGR